MSLASNKARRTRLERVFRMRRENLRAIAKHYGSLAALARALGVSAQYVNQLIGPNPIRSIGETTARDLEVTLRLQPGYLDMAR